MLGKKDEPGRPGAGAAGRRPRPAPRAPPAWRARRHGRDGARGGDARRRRPPSGGDTVASVDAEWKAIRNATPAQYREFMRRFQAAPGGPAQREGDRRRT